MANETNRDEDVRLKIVARNGHVVVEFSSDVRELKLTASAAQQLARRLGHVADTIPPQGDADVQG